MSETKKLDILHRGIIKAGPSLDSVEEWILELVLSSLTILSTETSEDGTRYFSVCGPSLPFHNPAFSGGCPVYKIVVNKNIWDFQEVEP